MDPVDEIKTMKHQLELDLHRQFAENQNSHQNIFMQMVVAFIGLFAALGYVYSHLEANVISQGKEEILFKPIVMHMTITVESVLFCLMAMIVIEFGWSFRRDMCLNKKIREKAYSRDCEYNVLFEGYGNNIDKMPDFYGIFLGFIVFIQFGLLFFSLTFDCCCCKFYCCPTNPLYPSLNFFLIVLEWVVQAVYYMSRHSKLQKMSETNR